jgi:hypothetical protein
MSLRKSICLTPQRLDAARRNSQRSTGPRTEAGKQRMKLNALKHGCDAAPGNDAAVMRALGEDPERYAALQRELSTAYGPGDALWDRRQTEDLARLYWRRNRMERMVTGLMRDALEKVEERRRSLARALADVTFEPSQCDAVTLDLRMPSHPCVRLRMLISLLGVIREQVRRRVFTFAQKGRIESYYQEELGWRPRQICHLLGLFIKWAYLHDQPDQAGLVRKGDPPALPGRQQKFDRSGSPSGTLLIVSREAHEKEIHDGRTGKPIPYEVGVQISRRIHSEMPSQGAVPGTAAAFGGSLPKFSEA